MDPDAIELRTAAPGDIEFLRRVHREAMRPHVERVYGGWDDAGQRQRFDASTDPSTHRIIEMRGEAVGCVWVREHADCLELVRLYLLERSQGRGIGSRVLEQLCDEADRAALPMRLRVLTGNQAIQLYRRFGFRVVEDTDTHHHMVRGQVGRST